MRYRMRSNENETRGMCGVVEGIGLSAVAFHCDEPGHDFDMRDEDHRGVVLNLMTADGFVDYGIYEADVEMLLAGLHDALDFLKSHD